MLAELMSLPDEPAALYSLSQESAIDEHTRRARSVTPPANTTAPINRVFDDVRPALEDHFQVTLREREEPHYLVYHPGDFFVAHHDRPRAHDTAISSRQISGVLFLNDNFSGGDLRFYGLFDGERWATIGFPCPPAPGLLVAFPAGTLHEVAPITAGVRGTVVTWFS